MVKKKYIGIRLAVLLVFMLTGIRSWSQSATYYHHYDWLQQFLVKETGTGVLTPDWYYSLVYPNYKKTAYIYNKTGFRVSFGANKQQQIGMSVKIDSVMTQRAKEEAWNMTDRISATTGIDLPWNTEKDKIEEQLRILQAQTNNIIPSGGTFVEKDEYVAIYNSINCAINSEDFTNATVTIENEDPETQEETEAAAHESEEKDVEQTLLEFETVDPAPKPKQQSKPKPRMSWTQKVVNTLFNLYDNANDETPQA